MRNASVAGSASPFGVGLTIPVGLQQMTMALFGLAIYLFCIHSFIVPLASLGIAIGVLGVLSRSKEIVFPKPLVWFAAWLLWCAVGALLSPFRSDVVDPMIEYLKILLIFFVALNAARTLAQLTIFIGTWVFMFGLFPLRGTYFNFLAGISEFGRYGWNFSFSNFNDLAAYAILALAMSAFLLAGRYARWIRVMAFLGCAALSLLIFLTQSRGAFIALIVSFAMMISRSRRRSQLIRFGLIALVGIAVVAPGAVWERFSRMKYLTSTDTLGEADSSAEQRYVLLQVGLEVARKNLLTGVGLGAYSLAHGAYAEERPEWQFGRGNRDTHNMYVNLVAETGLPGAVLFLGVLFQTLRYATRTEQRLRGTLPMEAEQLRILRFGLVAYLIAAIFGTFHRVSFLYLYLAVVWTASTLFEQMAATSGPAGPFGLPTGHGLRPTPRLRGFTRSSRARLG